MIPQPWATDCTTLTSPGGARKILLLAVSSGVFWSTAVTFWLEATVFWEVVLAGSLSLAHIIYINKGFDCILLFYQRMYLAIPASSTYVVVSIRLSPPVSGIGKK